MQILGSEPFTLGSEPFPAHAIVADTLSLLLFAPNRQGGRDGRQQYTRHGIADSVHSAGYWYVYHRRNRVLSRIVRPALSRGHRRFQNQEPV